MDYYEEKYKQALERAKYALTTDMDNSGHWAVNYIFPELKVSDSERMLREIKRYIKEQGDKPTGLPNGTVAVSDMIAWLDKQVRKKELKKVEQGNHPRIVMADFTGGEGFYKLNIDNLNKEQITAIEIMINNPKPSKKIDANRVIEWLKNTIKERAENYGVYKATRLILPYDSIEDLINDFKEGFGL